MYIKPRVLQSALLRQTSLEPALWVRNYYMKVDHRRWRRNFCSCEKKARKKKFRLVSDSNPWPLRYRCNILSRVYNEQIQRPAPSWLITSIGKSAVPVTQRSRVRIPYNPDFFFPGFLFAAAKVASITPMIYFNVIIIHPAAHIYDFHIFITSLRVRLSEMSVL